MRAFLKGYGVEWMIIHVLWVAWLAFFFWGLWQFS